MPDVGLTFSGDFKSLKDFMSFLQHTALDQIIEALGWMLEKKVDDVVDRHVTSLVCVPKPAALAVSYEDLIYRLAIHLFLVKI